MGTFLPNGYGIWKPTFTLDGSTKIFQTTFMVQNLDTLTANQLNTHGRTAFASAGRPYVAANMFIGYTLARTEAYVMTGGVLTYDLNSAPIVGTKAGSTGTPINTSIILKKYTGIVGKAYRGRFMLPNMTINEANISQAGILDGTAITLIEGQYDAAFTAWNDASWKAVLGHTSSEILPTDIIEWQASDKVGSMPHRIRGF